MKNVGWHPVIMKNTIKVNIYVTNSYLLSTSLKLNSNQLAVGARVLQSKGVTTVVNVCSFMLGPNWEGGVLGCNAGWELVLCGELASSSIFAVLQDGVSTETLTLKRIQHSGSVQSLLITPETGWKEQMTNSYWTVGGELTLMLQLTSIKSKECTITNSAIVSHWRVEDHKQLINT